MFVDVVFSSFAGPPCHVRGKRDRRNSPSNHAQQKGLPPTVTIAADYYHVWPAILGILLQPVA
jgi:hypothetical protein